MQSIMTAVTGTIEQGELKADMSLFPDGTKVIVLSREDWNRWAGSDSARHQLEQKESELTQTRQQLTAKESELTAVRGEVKR